MPRRTTLTAQLRLTKKKKKKNLDGVTMRSGSAERVPRCLCLRRWLACGDRPRSSSICRGRPREGSMFCGDVQRRFFGGTKEGGAPGVPPTGDGKEVRTVRETPTSP